MHIFQTHLPFSLLADIAEGRAAPDADARSHLAACPTCAENLAWLSRLIGLMRADASEEPAPLAVGAVKALFRARPPRSAQRPALLTALLRFDSARSAPAFGLRSAAAAERQLLFSAGPYDVDLRVVPAGERWSVSGQLLGDPGSAHGHAEMLGHADAAHAELNAQSEFALRPLLPGRYTLTIRIADQAIVLPDVELSA